MPATRTVTVNGIEYYIFAKSVQVCTPVGHEWVFFGKAVDNRDIAALSRLVYLGGKMKAQEIKAALCGS